MIVKDNFYIARYGDDSYQAKFIPTASTIEYISHKEMRHDYYEQHFYTISCILNKSEKITLRVRNNIGSNNYQLTNCSFYKDRDKAYVYWKDLFVSSFGDFLKEKKKKM